MKPRPLIRLLLPLLFVMPTCVFLSGRVEAVAEVDSTVLQPDWIADGTQIGGAYGQTAASAGDVNGDGYDDVIIGAPKHDDGTLIGGALFVFHGAPQGLQDTAAWEYGGENKGDRLGAAAASAGDVNNDGFGDVIVGAYRYGGAGSEAGRAYLFLGSAAGLAAEPAWSYSSDQAGAQFGYALSGAGDVNGDGYGDVVVGARWYDFGETNEGAAYLFLGTANGLEAVPRWMYQSNQNAASFGFAVAGVGDVNADGHADVLVGSPQYDGNVVDSGAAFLFYGSPIGLSPEPDWTASGSQSGAEFGAAVEAAGDLNGDGLPDIFIGAPNFATEDGLQLAAGAAYVYYGGSNGPANLPGWQMSGMTADCAFGVSGGASYLAGGDVNGDGFTDLTIGAYLHDQDQPDEGGLFVYFGGPYGLRWTPTWLAFGEKAEATFGFEAHLAGDVNQDGFADIIVGAPLYRRAELLYGRALLYLGRFAVPDAPIAVFLPLATRH